MASSPRAISPDLTARQAARTIWKDETAELSGLQVSLRVVSTQVKLDKVVEFASSMGAFALQELPVPSLSPYPLLHPLLLP